MISPKLAKRLNPGGKVSCVWPEPSAFINVELGTALVRARRFDEAIERLQKTLEIDPKFGRAYLTLAEAYLAQGDRPRAVAAFEKAALSDDPRFQDLRRRMGLPTASTEASGIRAPRS